MSAARMKTETLADIDRPARIPDATTPSAPPLPATDVVLGGRYRLGALIGRGGMAAVYRAKDERLGRDVAIKLFGTAAGGGEEAEQIRNEVGVLAGLNHPNLVTVFDAGIETETGASDRRAYLVMELIESRDLHRARQLARSNGQGRLSSTETTTIGIGVAKALAHIHNHGIVHRDVKPANILPGGASNRHRTGHPKLTDFGIAGLVQRRQPDETGQFPGTATYSSPEQASGGAITAATDIYSLALVLLECLTGEVAFPGAAVPSAAARLHRNPHIPTGLGRDWIKLLTIMTAHDPSARPTAVEVTAALRSIAGDQRGNGYQGTGTSAPTEQVSTITDTGSGQTPTRWSTEDPGPHTSPMSTVSGANASQPHPRWTGSRLYLPEEDETHRNHAGRTPGKRRPHRLLAWTVAALTLTIAIIAVLTALTLIPDSAPPPVDYPAVPAELGNSLEDLQESINRR